MPGVSRCLLFFLSLFLPIKVMAAHKSARRCSIRKEDLCLSVVEDTLLGLSEDPPRRLSVLHFMAGKSLFLTSWHWQV
jgi:hypothetical protein